MPPTLPTTNRNTSDSYTSSLSPTSPISYTSHPPRERSPSPSRLQRTDFPPIPNHAFRQTRRRMSSGRLAFTRHIRPYLSTRNISSIFLWALAVWLIHHFLLPLPLPRISGSASKPKSADHLLSTSFPPPPLRAGDDLLDSVDPRWRPFAPIPPPNPPFPRLRPTRFLPPKCLEQWFTDGETLCGKEEMGEEEKLDATWLWVNGSDHRWRDSMIAWRSKEGVYSPEHHFREQNELVHSMRSVLDALPGHLRTFHLIVADYPFDFPNDLSLLPPTVIPTLETFVSGDEEGSRRRNYPDNTIDNLLEEASNNLTERLSPSVSPTLASYLASTWRVAQTPTWLDFSRRDTSSPTHPFHPFSAHKYQYGKGKLHHAEADYPTLRYAAHSEVFHLPSMDRDAVTEELGEREWREREWRKKALPSRSVANDKADVMISLNDDFFLLRPHAVSDFHSPLYGSVIRFDHGYYQQVRPILDKSRFNDAGEVGGLYHANHILSQRFPRRLRPYFAHVPKVITRSLHHEASLMFKEDLAASSQRRFREMTLGEGDIQMQWLLTSLRVERWREALLWTYVVANLGALEPEEQWGDTARKELKDMFGLTENDEDVIKIEVHRGERWTLEQGRMDKGFEQAGWEPPKATEFLWSSMDGHIPPILKPGVDVGANDKSMLWTVLDSRGHGLICGYVQATHVPISRVWRLFDYGLGHRVGTLGYLPPPHLPLTPTWHEADFSLANVMSKTALPREEVNLREYTMKLLSRYQYLSAKSTSHFHMLKSAEHAHRVFKMIQDNPAVSILGLNDDIEQDYDEVKDIMEEWFELRWPRKAVWERGWDAVKDRYVD
ncbi:hypothetical protein CI109_106201 [Kwoniella shandongensis]|uniref:3-O-alpha-D-mannopyranosyl-alpha-D-mannopyranose xylosylphosphotransferase n=1 Tax=Kwoniella shandongensis TaxID=1734106 RepID=A0AAJ8LRY1_9TREE